MGIVFIMFAELWVTFFRHVQNYGSKFLTKMVRPRPKLGPVNPTPPPPPPKVYIDETEFYIKSSIEIVCCHCIDNEKVNETF